MKIVLFANCLAAGGTERVAATLANYWAGRRWEVTLVTLAPAAEDFYALDPTVSRVSLDLAGESGNAMNGVLQNMRRVVALRRMLQRLRPTVAIAMMSTPNVLLALAGRGIEGMRAVGSEHCYPPHAPLGTLWTIARRRAYGRLAAVVALTRECARWIETNTSARTVPVIPNPVTYPLPATPPWVAPDSVVAPGRKVLLAVGRLHAVKNLPLLVEVFSRLGAAYPDWDLVLLGDGPERAALAALIGALGLEDRIFMPGVAGNVAQWHARSALYVLTSESEGFPNALAEAMANGLPAVSVDCDTGPRDIVRHGIDGLLVAPGNAEALADALGTLMGNAALRQQFADNAGDARQRFGIDRVGAMWDTLFAELATRRPSPERQCPVPDSGYLP
jgi:glycosyltransferase involved in cell wall biosynthesis